MKRLLLPLLLIFSSPFVFTYDRLTPENSALILIDHQTGLCNGVADQSMADFKNNVFALIDIGKLYNLPVVLTSSAETGPNGPLLPEILDAFPDAPVIRRPGQIDAWANADFVEAVRRTGRKKLIMAGVSTEVCLTFASLSAKEAGYEVYAVIDASGTWSEVIRDVSVARMVKAGIEPMTWFAVTCELQGDWRHSTGAGLAQLLGDHLPFYGNLINGRKVRTPTTHSEVEL